MTPERCAPYSAIHPKFRLGPVSVPYNILVSTCPECDHGTWTDMHRRNNYKAIQGFADWRGYAVVVMECPKCFAQWWHHADKDYVELLHIVLHELRKEPSSASE
jgi:hypothetical protein